MRCFLVDAGLVKQEGGNHPFDHKNVSPFLTHPGHIVANLTNS